MKLPEKIRSRHRLRDGAIVSLWARDIMPKEKIAEKYKLTVRRIEQILYKNHLFVEYDINWEKKKRLQRLQSWLKDAPEPQLTKLAYQQELRSELEGNKPLIEQHSHTTYVWQNSSNPVLSTAISERNP